MHNKWTMSPNRLGNVQVMSHFYDINAVYRIYSHIHLTLSAGLLSFHSDLGMEPSLVGGLRSASLSMH